MWSMGADQPCTVSNGRLIAESRTNVLRMKFFLPIATRKVRSSKHRFRALDLATSGAVQLLRAPVKSARQTAMPRLGQALSQRGSCGLGRCVQEPSGRSAFKQPQSGTRALQARQRANGTSDTAQRSSDSGPDGQSHGTRTNARPSLHRKRHLGSSHPLQTTRQWYSPTRRNLARRAA